MDTLLWIVTRLLTYLRRGWKRLLDGRPSTAIAQPFQEAQATSVLNAVLDRGTFAEINVMFAALGRLGYSGVPTQEGPWRIVQIIQGEA